MAKIAVLADIHANIWALDVVLEDVQARGITTLVNLGDALYGPLAPRATFERLREVAPISISGNQDRLVADTPSAEMAGHPTLAFVREELPTAALSWLRRMPTQTVLNEEIFLCHGVPGSDRIYLMEDVAAGSPQLRSPEALAGLLEGVDLPMILCGHSHLPHLVQMPDGRLVVNPGSVGLPAYTDERPVPHRMENHAPHARYAIIEKTISGWNVAHLSLAYPWPEAVAAAERQGREDWARALATGYC
ncbi:MAG: metallophosphoesterase family protein [Desulfosarcinaceae bacterium]|jgi:predicted phosphodiesterase